MNPRDEQLEQPRILGRLLATETTLQKLDDEHGGESARPTWTLRFPPDMD